MSSQEPLKVSREHSVTIISLGPEYENLDDHLLDDLKEAILQATQVAEPPLVVLDLSHTRFFGSAFIEILFRAWKRLGDDGGRFAISGLTPYCREVIEVTQLDKLWEIYPTRAEAVQAVLKK